MNKYNSVPLNERPNFYTEGEVEPQCNNEFVSAEKMNAYQFQTEELLTTTGLNLYPPPLNFFIRFINVFNTNAKWVCVTN